MTCNQVIFGQITENINVKVLTPYPSYITLDEVNEIAKIKCFEEALDLSKSYINIEKKTQSTTVTKNDSITSDNYLFNFNTNHSARIISYEIISKNIVTNGTERNLELEMLVLIQAYKTKLDKAFTFQIEDIETSYIEGDFFKFKFTPNLSGYLSIYIIDGNEVYNLFPNAFEKVNFFEGKQRYIFPLNRFVEYELETNKNETSNFYFIYKKSDIKLLTYKTPKDFLAFLNSLELNERAIEIKPITILEK
jgi:hypothetical protein